MTNRERFKTIMAFGKPDRIPRIEFASYWDKTVERWIGEGLSPQRADELSLRRDFGLDDYRQFWFEPYSPECRKPAFEGFPLISTDDEYSVIRGELYPSGNIPAQQLRAAASGQERGEVVVWITLEGFFWFPRYLLGVENHLLAFYDKPSLVHRINDELADYHCSLIERLGAYCIPDFMTFAEDLSYNLGPMIGKDLFDEFLLPYYRRVVPLLKDSGTLVFVDTDGRIGDIIPWYQQAGFQGCLPVECNAGNDPCSIRAAHPDWLMIGGIEKRALYSGLDSMKREIRQKFRLAGSGGYIPSVDHQTPPEVSLSDYRAYLEELKLSSLL